MSNSNTGYDVVVDVDDEARPSFPPPLQNIS